VPRQPAVTISRDPHAAIVNLMQYADREWGKVAAAALKLACTLFVRNHMVSGLMPGSAKA
jgi:hypothetical protein